ncbi:unnamed protein product, partial [Rotaria sordida]
SSSISNDAEYVTEDKEITLKWSERSSSMIVWNNIGATTCYCEQIQIPSHDVSHHHSITIDNKTDKYSIGDLSLLVIVLASFQTRKRLFISYQSWDSNMRMDNYDRK